MQNPIVSPAPTNTPFPFPRGSSSLDLILAASGGQILIPLGRACEIAGFSSKTWRNWESEGRALPFPATPGHRRVDARDLAAYVDSFQDQARPAAVPKTKTVPFSHPKRGRGRPPKRLQQQEGGAQ